jgi:DNA topoisomerase-1
VEKRIVVWADKIRKLEIEVRNKNDNKEVSLGTSKINYCDPRISVAWCKNNEVGGGG